MSQAVEIYSALEEACNQGEFSSVEKLLQKLAEMITEEKASLELYVKGIVKALTTFKGKFTTTKIRGFIDHVKKLVEENPKHEKLVISYAKTLRTSLTALKTKGQPNLMHEIITNLENLTRNYPDNITLYEELSIASNEIINYWKKRGDFKAVHEQTNKVRELAKKFPENENIQLQLSKSIIAEIGSTQKRDIAKIDKLLHEIQSISETRPTNIGMQLEWVHAYRTAMDRTHEKPKDAKRWLASMKKIAQPQKDLAFKIELAKGYENALIVLGGSSEEELKKLLAEFKTLIDNTEVNAELHLIYARSLLEALKILGIKDYAETQKILDQLKKIFEQNTDSKPILEAYLEALVGIIGLLSTQKKGKEVKEILETLEILKRDFPEEKLIQEVYHQIIEVLKMIGFKKEEKKRKPRIGYL